jgi:hypothetical protein
VAVAPPSPPAERPESCARGNGFTLVFITVATLPTDRGRLVRPRVAVSAMFLLYGTILGTWTARIPAIKQKLGLTDGQLSVGLLAFARVAGLGFLGFVVGPATIGGTAQLVGLPVALAIPAVLAFFVALAAPALRTATSPAPSLAEAS